jgi:hypothetical protein
MQAKFKNAFCNLGRRNFTSAVSASNQRRVIALVSVFVGRACKKCWLPERFAQEAFGHNSKAVHRAYARKAKVVLPSLGEYERQRAKFMVLPKSVETPALASA